MNNRSLTTKIYHTHSAFSLVELVLTLAIVSILAAISVISFSAIYAGSQLNTAADRMVADLKLTRQQAINKQTTLTFEINPAANYYQVADAPGLVGTDSIYLDLNQPPYNTVNIDLNLQVPDNFVIQFGAQGQVANPGSIILSNGSRSKTITITSGGHIDASP